MTYPFNNQNIASFYQGQGTYPQGGARGNMGRARRQRVNGMGTFDTMDSSYDGSDGFSPSVDNSGLTQAANDIASLTSSGQQLVTGALQAEAAQNAINAQRNLTSALTPGVITMGLALMAYLLIVKK